MTTQPEDLRSEPATPTEGGEQPQVPDPTQHAEPAGAVAVRASRPRRWQRRRRLGPAWLRGSAGGGGGSGTRCPGRAAHCCSRASRSRRPCCRAARSYRAWSAGSPPRSATASAWSRPGSGARSPTGTSARPGRTRGASSRSWPSSRWSPRSCSASAGSPRSATSWGWRAATRPPCCWCRWWPPSCSSSWSRWPAACARSTGGWPGCSGRWIGPRAARAVGWVTVVGVTIALVSGVLLDGLVSAADEVVLRTQRDHHRGRAAAHRRHPVRRTRIPGRLGHPGPRGPQVHRAGADRVGHLRVHRRAGARADPGVRRPGVGRLDRGPRATWRSTTWNAPAASTASISSSPRPPAAAGSTRRRWTRSST